MHKLDRFLSNKEYRNLFPLAKLFGAEQLCKLVVISCVELDLDKAARFTAFGYGCLPAIENAIEKPCFLFEKGERSVGNLTGLEIGVLGFKCCCYY